MNPRNSSMGPVSLPPDLQSDLTAFNQSLTAESTRLLGIEQQLAAEKEAPSECLQISLLKSRVDSYQQRIAALDTRIPEVAGKISTMQTTKDRAVAELSARATAIGRLECLDQGSTEGGLRRLARYERATAALRRWVEHVPHKLKQLESAHAALVTHRERLATELAPLASELTTLERNPTVKAFFSRNDPNKFGFSS